MNFLYKQKINCFAIPLDLTRDAETSCTKVAINKHLTLNVFASQTTIMYMECLFNFLYATLLIHPFIHHILTHYRNILDSTVLIVCPFQNINFLQHYINLYILNCLRAFISLLIFCEMHEVWILMRCGEFSTIFLQIIFYFGMSVGVWE